MSSEIIVHEEARFDVIDIAFAIAEDNLEAADRFAEAIAAAYDRLAETPGIGAARDFGNPKLKGMRMWLVPGFSNYLIFYTSSESELRILRVLHGARDVERLFAQGSGIDIV